MSRGTLGAEPQCSAKYSFNTAELNETSSHFDYIFYMHVKAYIMPAQPVA